jgi:hypothetical protein
LVSHVPVEPVLEPALSTLKFLWMSAPIQY